MQVATDAPARPALRYYGGKWRLAPWIISHFPQHQNYVEPCGGAASVLLQKPRSPLETYNDLDGDVVNFFRVLRDRPDELIRKIRLTPWAREEHEIARSPHDDLVENARRFFMSGWMSISGSAFDESTGWRSTSYHGQSFVSHIFQKKNTEKVLKRIAERFSSVQIEQRDASYVIERYGNFDGSLIYFDPPYVKETRKTKSQYKIEADDRFHIDCADLLRFVKGCVVVSGYACDLYRDLYEAHGWTRYDRQAQTNGGGKRIESLWLSPRTVEALDRPKQDRLF
jgi:DNA adenine methylase